MVPVLNNIGTDVSCVGVSGVATIEEYSVLTSRLEP